MLPRTVLSRNAQCQLCREPRPQTHAAGPGGKGSLGPGWLGQQRAGLAHPSAKVSGAMWSGRCHAEQAGGLTPL